MNKKQVMIKKFTDSDLTEVLAIERNSFSEPWNKGMFEYLSKKHNSDFLVAHQNGRVVGYIIATDENYFNRIKVGHILNLAVDKEYRRQGIGLLLVQSILEKLLEKKVSKVYLEVRSSNSAAMNLYLKFGFKLEKVLRAYYQDNEDAYLMSKKTLP